MSAKSNTLPSQTSSRAWTIGIFLILLLSGALLALFAYNTTTNLSEALAEEVLEQQRDVAELLHEYSTVELAIAHMHSEYDIDQRQVLLAAIDRASNQLKRMRANYSFERLDGAARAHAYAKPVLEDVQQWIRFGIQHFDSTHSFVLDVAANRMRERYPTLRNIALETDQVAQSLISKQRDNIGSFAKTLLVLLACFAALASAISALLIRQRNMQAIISTEQQSKNLAVIEAETRGRKKAETALTHSEKLLRETLDSIPANITMIDSKGVIVAANKPWKHFVSSGGSYHNGGVGNQFDAVYKSLIEHGIKGTVPLFDSISAIQDGTVGTPPSEFTLEYPDEIRYVELSAIPFENNGERHTLIIHEDVTEHRKLEERDRRLRADLAHVSRLTSAGELATGLAHELNQPLTAISHNCHTALEFVHGLKKPHSELRETLDDIYGLAQRAGNIIRSMRRFTRKDSSEMIPTDINELIKETARITLHEARENGVDVELDLIGDSIQLTIDPVQIQQVLVNLQRNSLEAMGRSATSDSQLTISSMLTSEHQLQISVKDNGPGISNDIKDTLFETFQTTKSGSMGLGLGISASIVEAHGGRLWVEDNPERGVTFLFTLPLPDE